MPENNPIRLSVVRCDTHAYWYGVFLDDCDVGVLSAYDNDAPTRPCVHYYFMTIGDPRRLKIEKVGGFSITKIFDRLPEKGVDENGVPILQYGTYPGRAQEYAKTFCGKPRICETIEEMTVDTDAVYIADSSAPGDGADHLELARPFLEKGIPTFVDKPFAATLSDALTMVRLAVKNKTPVMSASILTHTDQGKLFAKRFGEIGGCGYLVVKGVGPGNAAVIHGIGLAHGLMGYGVEAVQCMGQYEAECMLLYYSDGREAVVLNAPNKVFPRTCSFYATAFSAGGALLSPPIGDWEFHTGTHNIAAVFKEMVQTNKPQIPYNEVLEPIAIMEAARIAQKEGRRVELSEVWDRAEFA